MADILHSAITDTDRHEAKGASTASNGQALFANGDGTTQFRKINYADLNVKPTSKGYLLDISSSSAAATQKPSTSDTALQVKFGSTSSTSNISINVDGTITFITAGQYAIRYGFSFQGGSVSGGSVIFFRVLLNGNPLEPTHRVEPSQNQIEEFFETFFIDANSNDKITFEITSDSSGASIGGLAQASPNTSGWSSSQTAEVSVYKFSGIQ